MKCDSGWDGDDIQRIYILLRDMHRTVCMIDRLLIVRYRTALLGPGLVGHTMDHAIDEDAP